MSSLNFTDNVVLTIFLILFTVRDHTTWHSFENVVVFRYTYFVILKILFFQNVVESFFDLHNVVFQKRSEIKEVYFLCVNNNFIYVFVWSNAFCYIRSLYIESNVFDDTFVFVDVVF